MFIHVLKIGLNVYAFPATLSYWGGVLVGDQVQLEMLGRFSIDLLEKLQPLLMLSFNTPHPP
ncbi:hypothetical protein CLA18_28440 [Pseudomonas protegens]|nr:hypothetical protein [Pseudomonas protegens]MBP5118321.1 hypothetical protein [Pseudomonas protegens]MBP5127769.1 hypothetical protein [Pseudomonas protegens]MBP5146532.1 hypothetical protein [Pseudomonas protegens]QEN50296.1 hypothetical protein CLA18_28440 [Pseudomonas protegens]